MIISIWHSFTQSPAEGKQCIDNVTCALFVNCIVILNFDCYSNSILDYDSILVLATMLSQFLYYYTQILSMAIIKGGSFDSSGGVARI